MTEEDNDNLWMRAFAIILVVALLILVGVVISSGVNAPHDDPFKDPNSYVSNFEYRSTGYDSYSIWVPRDIVGESVTISDAEIYKFDDIRNIDSWYVHAREMLFTGKNAAQLDVYGEGTVKLRNSGKSIHVYYVSCQIKTEKYGNCIIFGLVDDGPMDYMLRIPGAYRIG